MARSLWVSFFRSTPSAKITLFCFPYAGGSGQIFASWKDSLPAYVDVAAINLPGRGARMMEAPYTQMDPLVADLLVDIAPFMNKPYVLFGHSLGATIAFELSRSLRLAGRTQPVHFIAAGRRAPHIENDIPPSYHLPDAAFKEEIRRKKGTPQEILNNDELMSLVLPMLKADFQIADTHQYREGAPFSFPLTYYWGNEDKEINRNNDNAWAKHTAKSYQHVEFSGGHFFLHSAKEMMLKQLHKDLLVIGTQI